MIFIAFLNSKRGRFKSENYADEESKQAILQVKKEFNI